MTTDTRHSTSPIFRMTWLMSDNWHDYWHTWFHSLQYLTDNWHDNWHATFHRLKYFEWHDWRLTWQLICDIPSSWVCGMTWLTTDTTTSMTIYMRNSFVSIMWNDKTDGWHDNWHDNWHVKFHHLEYLEWHDWQLTWQLTCVIPSSHSPVFGMTWLMTDTTADKTIDM